MASILISVEGVLGREDPIQGFHPQPEAIRLLAALKQGYKIMLCSINPRRDQIEWWLKLNGLTEDLFYETLVTRTATEAALDETEVRVNQLRTLRGKGWDVALFVSADADAVANAVALGVQSVLWASPSYLRPDFVPGGARRPKAWDEIEDEVDRQKVLLVDDERRKLPEVVE